MYDSIYLTEGNIGFYHDVRKRNIAGEDYDMVFVLMKEHYENILQYANFSIKVTSQKLKEAGYLKTKDARRNTYPYTINDQRLNCFAVYYKDRQLEKADLERRCQDEWHCRIRY